MRRSFSAIVFFLLIAQAVHAQISTGQIIVLQNAATKKFLSAAPGEGLYMSANTAGWEQWRYSSTGPLLTSFHGTPMYFAMNLGKFGHAPYLSSDMGVTLERLGSSVDNGVTTWHRGAPGSLMNNDQVVLTAAGNGASNTSFVGPEHLLEAVGDSVGVKIFLYQSAPAVPDSARWTVISMSSYDTNRKLTTTVAMPDKYGYWLKSNSNTYLGYDQPFYARDGQTQQFVAHNAVHRATKPSSSPGFTSAAGASPLKFGDQIFISWMTSGVPMIVQPNTNGNVMIKGGGMAANLAWTILDSTGIYKTGDRVPLGGRICLHSSAGNISASPTDPVLHLSTNCAGWEWWTTEPL